MELATTNRPARLAMLEALAAVGALLVAPKLVLLTGAIPEGENLVPADVTPVTGGGYADGTPVPAAAYYDVEEAQLVLPFESFPFVADNTIAADIVISGWALMNTGKTVIGAIYRYEEPWVLSAEGDGINVEPAIRFGL